MSTTVRTSSGRVVTALTYNGTSPGPLLRARVGQLVEVVLRNADVASGVTIHWHGMDVPNAEDGVAGVTQDAVLPNQQHVYRFRPSRAGTFWYHSHQDAAQTVARGLYGAIIIDPADPADPADPTGVPRGQPVDLPLVAHTWSGSPDGDEVTIGLYAGVRSASLLPGRRAQLRLINTDSLPQTWAIGGVAFRVTAIDGRPVNAPTDLIATSLRLAAGGRYDVELTMPDEPVQIRVLDANQPGLLLLPGDDDLDPDRPVGTDLPMPAEPLTTFDPLTYGSPLPDPSINPSGSFDRDVEQVLDTRHGRRDGVSFVDWTVNGQVFPAIPPITVHLGDLVRLHVVNRGADVHPMHLHGHHVLVLERNGRTASGSPWWTDSLNIEPGDDFVLALRANNPGIWMDHCHNLSHAASGMMTELIYDDVTSPFSMDHGNRPE